MKRAAIVLVWSTMCVACAEPMMGHRTEVPVALHPVPGYRAAVWPEYKPMDDGRLVSHYFLVKNEFQRVSDRLRTWRSAIEHGRSRSWYKAYVTELRLRHRRLKRELKSRGIDSPS